MKIAFLFVLLLIAKSISGVRSSVFTIKNQCPYTIWPGLAGQGPGVLTGFELAPQASRTINVQPGWSGRVWGRFACSNAGGRVTCQSGDCGSGQVECQGRGGIPPTTLAEFTIGGSGGKDFYDVSNVDGFNLPLSIVPQGGGGCATTDCPADINSRCPSELAVTGSDGRTIGCKSA